MRTSLKWLFIAFAVTFVTSIVCAQSGGSSGSINGTVVDPTGAVVPNATVEIHNPVSHFDRSTTADKSGNFNFPNIPFNPYHMTASAEGFAAASQDVEVRSVVPVSVKISLQVSGSSTTVNVEAGADLLENDPTFHSDIDRDLFNKIPLESASSSLSSLVTLSSPGVAADSNGLFHSIGDHAENSFSIDGQPITDQQSKVFSNQVPVDSIESLEVIDGAPPAEYGGKTSLVIVATTRSGQGVTTPHGSVTTSYGSFGSSTVAADLAYGGKDWGNFISVNGLNTGRFLDPPEFTVIHDKGNEQNVFDRVDYQLDAADSVHINFGYSRSWFFGVANVDAAGRAKPILPRRPRAKWNWIGFAFPLGPRRNRAGAVWVGIQPIRFRSANVASAAGLPLRRLAKIEADLPVPAHLVFAEIANHVIALPGALLLRPESSICPMKCASRPASRFCHSRRQSDGWPSRPARPAS